MFDGWWDKWVMFPALGGFLGVFVLALCDHLENGSFYASEWRAVASSALAGGFLAVALADRREASTGSASACWHCRQRSV